MTASQLAQLTALSESEILALAYEEAAEGDLRRALMLAVVDRITLEERQAATESLVSRGYIRSSITSERR